MTGIARAARWTTGALAGLSARDLAGALVVAFIVVAAMCWVLRDEDRSRRLAEIISAWRTARPGPASSVRKAPRRRARRAPGAGSGPPGLPGNGTDGTG